MKQHQKKTLKNAIRLTLVCAVLALLTACPKEGPKNPPPPPPPPTPSLAEQIKTLEDTGAYPKLDRSTDLKGPDQILNGVRDDVEAWINAQPITDVQKKAAIQNAEAFQKTLSVDLADKVALQAVGDAYMAASNCLYESFMQDTATKRKFTNKIEAITFNTKERTMRYIAYNKALSGMSFSLAEGNTCK